MTTASHLNTALTTASHPTPINWPQRTFLLNGFTHNCVTESGMNICQAPEALEDKSEWNDIVRQPKCLNKERFGIYRDVNIDFARSTFVGSVQKGSTFQLDRRRENLKIFALSRSDSEIVLNSLTSASYRVDFPRDLIIEALSSYYLDILGMGWRIYAQALFG